MLTGSNPINRRYTLSREHQGPRAVLNALERLASGYGPECVRVRQELSIAESQLRDYQARLGKPFAHEVYLAELTSLRDQLKAALSRGNSGSDDDQGPSAFGMADKIKTIKATNTIEVTPQRKRQKQSTAEEPVTSRIRREMEAATLYAQATESAAVSSPTVTSTPAEPTTQGESAESPPSFQERIISERQQKDDELNPPLEIH